MREHDDIQLDRIADAAAERLAGRLGMPLPAGGEPGLERPPARPGGPAGGVPGLPVRRLRLLGIELTQSVQHFRNAFAADNSVPLVARKRLVVRAHPYVAGTLEWPDRLWGERVTGELVLSIGDDVVYRRGPTRAAGVRVGRSGELDPTLWDREVTAVMPGPDPLSVEPRYLNPPLSFTVPAARVRPGRVHVAVRVWRASAGRAAGADDSASHAEYAWFVDVGAPRVVLVPVNWDDGAGTVTRPADADMLATTRLAERMLPFPWFATTISAFEVTKSGAFAEVPEDSGGCNAAWQDLNTDLAVTRIFTTLAGVGSIVVGMVPDVVIPPGGGDINAGCGIESGGCIVGPDLAFAHEMGHLYGRRHVGVTGDENDDPDYPEYGGDRWSIGARGIDTGTAPPRIYDPETTDDLMSYRRTLWPSPYRYGGILENRWRQQDAPARFGPVGPYLVASIRLRRTGSGLTDVEMRRAFRVQASAPPPAPPEGATSPMSADLLDAQGRILATHHCTYVEPRGGCACGCGGGAVPLERRPYIDMPEAIALPEAEGAAIAGHRGGEPFARLEAGQPPRVAIQGPTRRRDGRLVATVRARHPRTTPSVAVLFSADDGATWIPVALDPDGGQVVIDPARLPGGERCRLRALATAELRSASADSEPFEVDATPRALHVAAPADPCGVPAGPVALAAMIDGRGHEPVEPHDVRWRSDLHGDLGVGYQVIADLAEGEHTVTVTAPDGLGGLLSERAIIGVGGRPAS